VSGSTLWWRPACLDFSEFHGRGELNATLWGRIGSVPPGAKIADLPDGYVDYACSANGGPTRPVTLLSLSTMTLSLPLAIPDVADEFFPAIHVPVFRAGF
jgi:hypothetical protein